MFVTLTLKFPAAVHETGGEGAVQYPCRVTNTTEHSWTPGEMLPAAVESATCGPSAGPIWLTRSKFESSYWRGKSCPSNPSENAMYSRPKCVVDAKNMFGSTTDAANERTPGDVSL